MSDDSKVVALHPKPATVSDVLDLAVSGAYDDIIVIGVKDRQITLLSTLLHSPDLYWTLHAAAAELMEQTDE